MLPWITLTTDFGSNGSYVAQLKAAILSELCEARIVDLCHEVPPHDIGHAALLLEDATLRFPPGTIHLVVVDPGVGGARAVIYAEIGPHRYIAPDNGVLGLVARRFAPASVRRLDESPFAADRIAPTFHGRDIMAPVAAHLARGVAPESLGPPLDALNMGSFPVPVSTTIGWQAEVLAVDPFGTLITNLREDELGEGSYHVTVGKQVARWVRTYADAPAGTVVALVGSSGRLEIAVVQGNAARRLQLGPGTLVECRQTAADRTSDA